MVTRGMRRRLVPWCGVVVCCLQAAHAVDPATAPSVTAAAPPAAKPSAAAPTSSLLSDPYTVVKDDGSLACTRRKFEVDKIYGNIDNAKICFDEAVRILGENWVPQLVGPCLRWAFHDCGTFSGTSPAEVFGAPAQCGGCNGSVKQEFEFGQAANNFSGGFPQQNGMQLCYNFLHALHHDVANKIRKSQPECANMTNADIYSIMGLLAVYKSAGSPPGGCPWHPGRPDRPLYDDTTRLPMHTSDDYGLIEQFNVYKFDEAFQHFGLNMEHTITLLSGSHTVGYSRVHRESPGSLGIDELTATPDLFDGQYFFEVVHYQGWFASDRHGLCHVLPNPDQELEQRRCADETSKFAPYYKHYAQKYKEDDDTEFHINYCKAYQAMSTIGYDFPSVADSFDRVSDRFRVGKQHTGVAHISFDASFTMDDDLSLVVKKGDTTLKQTLHEGVASTSGDASTIGTPNVQVTGAADDKPAAGATAPNTPK